MAPATAASEDVYRVLEPFSFDTPDGVTHVQRKGDIVTADSAAYRGRENSPLFERVTASAARDQQRMRTQVSAVEVATADPGQRRTRTVPAASLPPQPATPAPDGTGTPDVAQPPTPQPSAPESPEAPAPAPTPDTVAPDAPAAPAGRAGRKTTRG
jgi:hypothetical protein